MLTLLGLTSVTLSFLETISSSASMMTEQFTQSWTKINALALKTTSQVMGIPGSSFFLVASH
jgi:hypothetical protein